MSKPAVCVFCASSPGNKPVYEAASRSVGRALAEQNRLLVYGGGVRGMMGFVSDACLEAGGRVHGIIPSALTGRAAEKTISTFRSTAESGFNTPVDPSTAMAGSSQEADLLKSASSVSAKQGESAEGRGDKVVASDREGSEKFTTEVVGTMHERKQRMAKMSEGGFIVLPGGFGTFEEVMEMTTWTQLRIHQKPVVVLNVNGFYEPLRQQVKLAVKEGFIAPINEALIQFIDLREDDDPTKDWGKRAVEALEAWKFDDDAGYKLSWSEEGKPLGRQG